MTNLRHPSSHFDALTQAVAYLGKPEVARLMGKSQDIVDKCINPNVEGYHLPIDRAMAINTALAVKGFPRVFTLLLEDNADAAMPVVNAIAAAPEPPHVMVDRIVCGAAGVLDEFVAREKHKDLTAADRSHLGKVTAELQKRIAAFRRALWS